MLFQADPKDLQGVMVFESIVDAFGLHAPHVGLQRNDGILDDNRIDGVAPLNMNSNHIGCE